jgi:hypothetical protein
MSRPALTVAVALAAALLPAPGDAHTRSVVQLEIELEGSEVALAVRGTLAALAPTLAVAPAVRPLPELYRAKRETVLGNIAAYLTLSQGGGRQCSLAGRELEVDARAVSARLRFRCPRRAELVELRYDLLFDDDPLHRAFVAARAGREPVVRAVLDSTHRSFRLAQRVSPWQNAASFLALGVQHIFTGYDHVLFLIALMLVAPLRACASDSRGSAASPRAPLAAGGRPSPRAGLRHLLAVVTAFTVAHSVTLALSALELLALPPRVVEPAIALTIIYVAVENALARAPRWRWLLTFGFGLVHGFGFAHVLREVGLPQVGLLRSLAAFNLGVELGQLAVVALLFPAIAILARERVRPAHFAALAALVGLFFTLLAVAGVKTSWQGPVAGALLLAAAATVRRHGYRRVVLRGGSALCAALALLWLVERLLGRALLGGALG